NGSRSRTSCAKKLKTHRQIVSFLEHHGAAWARRVFLDGH
ncbi:MAG: hypothetical protein ACI9FJ_001613, partial [Alteromonadaceae bacterium]